MVEVEYPEYGAVSMFQDDKAVTRTASLDNLKTCFTGNLPFSTKFDGTVLDQLCSLQETRRAFYISIQEGQMTERLKSLVVKEGWSWNVGRGFAFISNAAGAAFGIPPNPAMICAPLFLAYFSTWSLDSLMGRPRKARVRKALKSYCFGNASFKEQPEQTVQPPGRFFHLGKFLPIRFASDLQGGTRSPYWRDYVKWMASWRKGRFGISDAEDD